LISTFWAPSQPDQRLRGIPSRLEKNAYEIAMSKTVNDSDLGATIKSGKKGKGGTKRRKLFPEKSKSQKVYPLGEKKRGINGGSKLSTANYSSLQSGSIRGKNNQRSFSNFSSMHSSSETIPGHVTAYSPPLDLSLPQRWMLLGNLAPIAPSSRQYMSSPRMIERTKEINIKKPMHSRSTYAKLCTKSIGNRGRLFAAGLALTAFFWNPTNASPETISSRRLSFFKNDRVPSCLNKNTQFSDASKPSIILRGGDYETDADSSLPQRPPPPLKFAHGTTTLSFAFQGGIIAAVDSRASMGTFVGSKTTQKVLPVSSHILGTMAGGAADCQHWIRKLKSEALLHELTEDGRRMSVARASRILANNLYELRGYDISVGTMIMGYDDQGISSNDDIGTRPSTPYIYYVDNTGLRIQGDLFAVGSGSTFALGILDTEENRYNLSVDEAVALGIKAIRYATFRDAYSGGYINVFLITPKNGWRKVYTEDIARTPEVWKALQEEKHESPK